MQNLGKIEAKKSLGQHFLNNTHVPSLMADAAEVQPGDIVLEIGPGTGVLTRELLNRGAKVIAIEADGRAVESLHESFESEIMAKKLVISHSDIREVSLESLELTAGGFKVVANIPYYISGLLFRFFLEQALFPSCLVFLVQKEVAERIARDPKESLLSLSIKVFGQPAYVKTVKRGNFTPPPKVDSAIIAVSHISKKHFEVIPEEFFFSVLHEGFKSKRKQLVGNLSTQFPKEVLIDIFSTLAIPEKTRGEDLGVEQWLKLVEKLYIHTR